MRRTREQKKTNPNRLPVWKVFAWQTSPISAGAVAIIMGYLMMYCTDVLGMSAVLVGSLLMASKLFDGITDLIAGWLVENTHSKLGKGRPYGLCLIGVWICTYALFAVPERWSMTGKAIWIFIMYTLIYSVFQTLLNAGETSYVIRAFGTAEAVTKVSSYGGIIITLASMVVSTTFPMFVARAGNDMGAWRKLMAMYMIPLLLLGLLRFLLIKEEKADDTEKSGVSKDEKVTMKDIFTLLTKNRFVWLLAIAVMIPKMLGGMSAATYYFKVIVGDLSVYSIIQLCSVAILVFMVVFPALMRRFNGMQVVGMAAGLGIVGYIMNFFAGGNVPILIVGSILGGISVLPATYLKSVLIMQVGEYNTIIGMKKMEATMAAVLNFLEKLGNAFASFLIGALLSAAHYDGTLAVQPESAVTIIRLAYSLIPAAFTLIVIFCVIGFKPMYRSIEASKEQKAEMK